MTRTTDATFSAEDIEMVWEGMTNSDVPSTVCYAPLFISLGVQIDGLPYIFITCPEKPVGLPRLEAIKTIVKERPRVTGENWQLIFVLENPTLKRAFSEMCVSFIARVQETDTARAALEAIYASVREWRNLLKIMSRSTTSNQIRGVLGELIAAEYIGEHTGQPIDRVLDSWSGPYMAPQDFIFENEKTVYEVKTIHPSAGSITISSPEQLDRPDWTLSLIVVELATGTDDDDRQTTLDGFVQHLVDMSHDSSRTQELIDDGLEEIGISTSEEIATSATFSIKSVSRFAVRDGFPRLTAASIPDGIENVTYQIPRHILEPFRIADDQSNPQHGDE
ncbi:PD-(D/E)XK motif protein [Bifidobacterium thermophilum]|uniref:PD-(D/E)XK motif protein n=1 Tax=Bifidobacterium thermophilum TaxID=33905 RepID=UPI003995656D